MKPPVFLYDPKAKLLDDGELDAATRAGFRIATRARDTEDGETVVARHYAWPWPGRLDRELGGARAVNPARAYEWADRPIEWSAALGALTPRTWTRAEELPELPGGFILKGAHAVKHDWSRMFAANRREAIELFSRLNRDTGFAGSEIVFREYVPLAELGDGFGGCPVAEEYRVFFYRDRELSRGLYWNREDMTRAPEGTDEAFETILREGARLVSEDGSLPYYTLDVARRRGGGWTIIEVSDGQRAGLTGNDPETLYGNLFEALAGERERG